jgi:propanol-preferring alcohol dehydrogenase
VARHWECDVSVFTRTPREDALARRLGASWVGGYDDPPPEPLDAAVTFAPSGAVVVAALRALAPGGTVAVNAIHLDGMPAFPYEWLWLERGIRSVANFTRRDAREFLDVAARIPIRPVATTFPLERAADALAAVEAGRLDGSAVLLVGGGDA